MNRPTDPSTRALGTALRKLHDGRRELRRLTRDNAADLLLHVRPAVDALEELDRILRDLHAAHGRGCRAETHGLAE